MPLCARSRLGVNTPEPSAFDGNSRGDCLSFAFVAVMSQDCGFPPFASVAQYGRSRSSGHERAKRHALGASVLATTVVLQPGAIRP
jgi:hypothetical protein